MSAPFTIQARHSGRVWILYTSALLVAFDPVRASPDPAHGIVSAYESLAPEHTTEQRAA